MKRLFITFTLLTCALSEVQAASVFSDGFAYADGSVVANSSGAWVNNTGTGGSCLASNLQLIVTFARTEDIGHKFSTVFPTNGLATTLYSSFTLRCTALPGQDGTYFAHFSGTNVFTTSPIGVSGFRARVWASTTNFTAVAAPGQFFLGIVNSGLGNATNGQWATPLDTNVTYTVVTRYVLATGASTLWINPTAESDPGVTATDAVPDDAPPGTLTTNGVVNISHYGFRQATGEGTMWIDDFKVGTAFNDVAGANTAPVISSIPNQNTPMNTPTAPIAFAIEDAETPAGSLILSNATSNPVLVPANNIVFGGGSTNRTITITPVTGEQGSASITIYVSDGVNTASTSFTLTVGAPSISPISNQITYSNAPITGIAFTIGDTESPANSLVVSNASSNPALITSVVASGTDANRTLTLTPVADQTGVATITIYVSDGINTASTSFNLSVSPKLGTVFSDTFSYTEFLQGTALLDATGSPWGHASGTNYDLLVIDGAAQLSFGRSEDLAAGLAGGPFGSTSGAVLYAGFTVNLKNLPLDAGNYFAHFKDSLTGTTFRGKIYVSTTNAAPGFFRIGIANAANTVSAQFPADLSTNQTCAVVSRYDTGTAQSVLWVNPTDESSPSVAALDDTAPSTVAAYGLRQDSGIGLVNLDNLKIGTSFRDVVPLVPVPLQVQTIGNSFVFTWSNPAFTIQSATNIAGPYVDIPGATSPHTNSIDASQMFFRLKATIP